MKKLLLSLALLVGVICFTSLDCSPYAIDIMWKEE